jgi:hypothetical protein
VGHGRLDSILGSFLIPGINLFPHNTSKKLGSEKVWFGNLEQRVRHDYSIWKELVMYLPFQINFSYSIWYRDRKS